MKSGNILFFSISAACAQQEEDLRKLKAKCHKGVERIVTKYLTKVLKAPHIPSSTKAKEAQAYAAFLQGAEKYLGNGSGCLLLWMTVGSLEALESLWQKSLSGALTNGFQREITTEEWLKTLSLQSVKIQVQMKQEDYLRAKDRLQAGKLCKQKTKDLGFLSLKCIQYLWWDLKFAAEEDKKLLDAAYFDLTNDLQLKDGQLLALLRQKRALTVEQEQIIEVHTPKHHTPKANISDVLSEVAATHFYCFYQWK